MNFLKNLQVTQIPVIYKQILKSVTSVRSGNPSEIVQNSAECSISKTWRSKSLSRCPSSVLSAVQMFSESLSSSTSALPQLPLKAPPTENSLTETVCSMFNLDTDRVKFAPNLIQFRQFSTLGNKSQPVTYKIRTKHRKYSNFKDFCSKLFNKKKKQNKSAKMEILPEKQEPNEKQARATPMKEGPDSEKKKKIMCVSKNQKPEKVCEAPKKTCVQPFGAEVVCPNPPKLGEDMSVPYYFKKVCVRSENGKCVRYEMQRVPMPDGIKKYQSAEEREKCVLPDVPIPRNEGKLVTISELSSTVENVKERQCADCKLCNARKALSLQKPPKQPEKPLEKRDLCAKYRIKSPTCILRKETESTKAVKATKSNSRTKIKKKGSGIKKKISKVVNSKRVKIIKKSALDGARKQLSKVIKIKPKMSKEAKEKLKQTQASRKEGKQPVWNPCEQIKKNASVIEQKAKRQSSSESSLCKKKKKKASVCDPCQKNKEEKPSVCDPCKKSKASSESSLCKNLKKKPSVCNPCKKEDKPLVCDPCEKVKNKASICDNKAKSSSKGIICMNLKKKAPPCDPCQEKKEKKASICDPCKTEAKDNDCSKQLKVKLSPGDHFEKLSKKEPICKPREMKDTKKESPCGGLQAKKKKQGRPCPVCYSKESSTSFLSKKCPKFPFRCPGEKKCKPEVVKVPRCESKESSPSNNPVKSKSTKSKESQTSKSKESAPSVPPNTPKKCSVYSNRSNTSIRLYHKRTGTDQTEEYDAEPKVCERMLEELGHSDRMAHKGGTTEKDPYQSYRRKWRKSSSRCECSEPEEPDNTKQAMPKTDTEQEDFRKPYRMEWTKSSSHYARSQIDGPENLFEELECDKFISEEGKEEKDSYKLYRKKRKRHSTRHSRSEAEIPGILLEELESEKFNSKEDKEEEGSYKLYRKKRKPPSSRHSRSETDVPEILLEKYPQIDKMIAKADTEEESSSAAPRRKWGRSKHVRSQMITSDTVFEEVTESDRTMPKTDIEDARSQQDASNSLLAKQVQSEKVIPNDNEDSSKTLGKEWRKSISKNARSKQIISDAALDKVTQSDKVTKPDIVDDDEWSTLSLKSVKKKSSERLSLNKHKEGSKKPEELSNVSRSLFRKLKRERDVNPCSRAGCDLCIARQTKTTCKPNIVCNPKLKKPPPCRKSPIISPDDIVFSKRYNICEDKKELINKPVKCVAKVCGAIKKCPAVVPSSPKLCKPLRRHPPVDKCSLKAKSPERSEPEPQTAEEPKHRKDIITNTICNQDACKKKMKATVCVRRHPPQPMKKQRSKLRCRSKASLETSKSKLSASRRTCSDANKATYITRFGTSKKRSTVKKNVGKVTKGHVFGPLKKLEQKKSREQLSPEVGEKVDKGIVMNLKGLIDSVCKILCPMRKMGPRKNSSISSIIKPSSQTTIKKTASKTKHILSDKKSDQQVAKGKGSTKTAEKKPVQSSEKHDKKKENKSTKSPTVTAKRSLCPFSKRERKERKAKSRSKMTRKKQ